MTESKFTVGQKVFDLRYGFGVIVSIESDIFVSFGYERWYVIDGRTMSSDSHPSLLTLEQAKLLGYEPMQSGPTLSVHCKACGAQIANEPEKKKIVRKIERWINIYESGMSGEAHESKVDADLRAEIGRITCVRVDGSYEIEE